jgi:hypothetical protein
MYVNYTFFLYPFEFVSEFCLIELKHFSTCVLGTNKIICRTYVCTTYNADYISEAITYYLSYVLPT